MAWIVADGFDYYREDNDLGRSVWDGFTGATGSPGYLLATPGRVGGQCMRNFLNGGFTWKNFAPLTTIFFSCAFAYEPSLSATPDGAHCFYLRNGVTNRYSISFDVDGAIRLRSGPHTSATILAAFPAAFGGAGVWNHFQFRVVVHDTNGSIQVRKNGQATDTFSATGLAMTGGAFDNIYIVSGGSSLGPRWRYDDVLVFSESGVAPNTWAGDTRAVCLSPNADVTTGFLYYPTNTLTVGAAISGTYTLPANRLYCTGGPFRPLRSGLVTKVTTETIAAYTGKLRLGIYANDGVGGPGTLLAQTTELVNPAIGIYDLTTTVPFSIDSGRDYWFATHTDTAMNLRGGTSASFLGRYVDTPYSGGLLPALPDTLTVETNVIRQRVAVTIEGHSTCVSEAICNADTDYIYSGTVGAEDRFDFADPPGGTFQIVGMQARMYARKSDVGTRGMQFIVISGASETATEALLATSWLYFMQLHAMDPATGVPWTVDGLKALRMACKVLY